MNDSNCDAICDSDDGGGGGGGKALFYNILASCCSSVTDIIGLLYSKTPVALSLSLCMLVNCCYNDSSSRAAHNEIKCAQITHE